MSGSEKWVAPALLFFAGAILGRVLGVKTLVRGAVAAATMTGMASQGAAGQPRAASRKIAHRTARKRPVQKRSKSVA